MQEKYFTVTLQQALDTLDQMQTQAFEMGCTGVEEFSLDEAQVDEILGMRSYSGGDVPEAVLDEVSLKAPNYQNVGMTFYFSTLADAEKFVELLKQKKIEYQLQQHDSQDWNAKWRESYAPIKISDQLEIVPSWQQTHSANSLLIYPGMGFGTGSHETTFLCLQAYERIRKNLNLQNCLDFGCGSGILGLATYLIYPDIQVDLYDIDQAALDNTLQNIQLNGFEQKNYRLLLPKERKQLLPQYDLVFANILKNVLELEVNYLAHSCQSGGHLILSGLLKGQEQDIIQLYLKTNPGLEHLATENKGDWICLVFRQGDR